VKKIGGKVNTILKKIGAEVDVSHCEGDSYQELSRKLDVIEKFVDVNEGLRKIESLKKVYENCCTAPSLLPGVSDIKEDDLVEAFRKCFSIKDIKNKFQEFCYSSKDQKMKCGVCDSLVATYKADQDDDFSVRVQSEKFKDLKKILRIHLVTKGHLEILKNAEAKEKLEKKIIGRERKICKVLGLVSYYLLKMGRPNTDFPTLVSILAACGVDVGGPETRGKYFSLFKTFFKQICKKLVVKI
jgi:galactitol-specific phosphotransferase system IIB component